MDLSEDDQKALEHQSVLAWIHFNGFVTENRKPVEFVRHRWLIDYLGDDHPDKVTIKCSQVGLTVAETLNSFHLAGHRGMNVIHTLQNSDVIKGFVTPKVNPLIEYNPAIKAMLKADSENLKQFNNNFVYYRGAQAESQAISISADVLNIDELDRSNQSVVEMYQSRLDFSDYKWMRRFSNPSAVGFGVDFLWSSSNQFHWFVRHSCGHWMYMDFQKGILQNHYIDLQTEKFTCGRCGGEITDEERISGEWVAKYPSRTNRHGYWFSQMMAPWFTAPEIVKKYRETSTDYFHNFVMGKPYTPSDLIVDRSAILKATSPSMIPKVNCALGVDNGVRKTWVLGTPDGIFAHGVTESWDEIENIILTYKPYTVIDPNPYPTHPRRLMEKYKGKVYICYFGQSTNTAQIIRWGEREKTGVVYADRTKILDLVAQEIIDRDIIFTETPSKMEDYIEQWGNIYRTTVEGDDGRIVSKWLKKEGKLNDFALATTYFRMALSKCVNQKNPMIKPHSVNKEDTISINTDPVLDWRYI
jgi:hypothetical protein